MYNQFLHFLYLKANKNLSQNSDRVSGIFERADKIIIWLVGFSIGVFVLLLGADAKSSTNFQTIKGLSLDIIIISLIIVILGLLFRLCSFFAQYYLNNAFMNFLGFTDTQVSFPDLPIVREIKKDDTIDDILFYLDIDYNHKREKPKYLPDNKMQEYREVLRRYYEEIAESNDEQKQLEIFWNTYAEYFGLSTRETEKYIKGKSNHKLHGKLQRIFLLLASILFFLTIGTFIFGTSLVLINIYCHSPAG